MILREMRVIVNSWSINATIESFVIVSRISIIVNLQRKVSTVSSIVHNVAILQQQQQQQQQQLLNFVSHNNWMLRKVICPRARNVHEKLTNSSKDVALLKFLINEKFRQRILCQIFRNGGDIPFYTFYFFFLFVVSRSSVSWVLFVWIGGNQIDCLEMEGCF